jgi:alpha-glucuronidase
MNKHVKERYFKSDHKGVTRRHFVKVAGITALGVSSLGLSDFSAKGVTIIVDPADPIAGTSPSEWAMKELEESLSSLGIGVFRCEKLSQAKAGDIYIVVAGLTSSIAGQILKTAKINIPDVPEAIGVVPVKYEGKKILLACGKDERGLVYALLELADRVHNSTLPLESLNIKKPVVEKHNPQPHPSLCQRY